MERRRGRVQLLRATASYLAIAFVATWPLVRGLGRDVPGNLGDAAATMWAIDWDCGRMIALLRGHAGAASQYFDANIFHPAPLALAYSDHLTAEAVQVLPVYALTHNPVLCYDLLFLSTFVLCGLGAFLLVRELTGDAAAGFIAGLLYAFAPYRFTQVSHLAVLSTQWMPLGLYAIRRYTTSVAERSDRGWRGGSIRALAGAAFATIAMCLSGGSAALYFAPVVATYLAWEIATTQTGGNLRMWLQLAFATLVVLIVTAPFLLPSLVLQQALHLEHARAAVVRHSADAYSYATAFARQPLWGAVARAWPKENIALFPGAIALLLAVLGVASALRGEPEPPGRRSTLRLAGAVVLALIAAVYTLAFAAVLLWRHVVIDVAGFEIHISNANQVLLRAAAAFALLCAISPRVRQPLMAAARTNGFFVLGLLAAAWLSLGPQPQSLGGPLQLFAPYGSLYDHLSPVRLAIEPARYATVVALMLAVLAGFGMAVIARRWRTSLLLPLVALLVLAEAVAVPLDVNAQQQPGGLAPLEAQLRRPARAPSIYRAVAALPADAVVAELPLGDLEYDRRAMFYSAAHGRSILNGYGEFFPPHYGDLRVALSDVPRYTGVAMDALHRLGTTHVLVHEGAYPAGSGEKTSAALRQAGATELDRNGTDVLLKLP